MQGRKKTLILNIAIINYQNCIFSPKNSDKTHYLSAPLLEHIKTKQPLNYFFGITGRCYQYIEKLKEDAKQHIDVSSYQEFDKDFKTEQITQGIEKFTHIPSLTVSTLDDMLNENEEDLIGYSKILKPWEDNQTFPEYPHVTGDDLFAFLHQKKEHLLLVAKYLANQFSKHTINLHVYDDDYGYIKDVFLADELESWPKDVNIAKAYHYNASHSIPAVLEIEDFRQCKGVKPSQSTATNCASLFSGVITRSRAAAMAAAGKNEHEEMNSAKLARH